MTPDQLKTIDAMNISGDTMVSMMRELGFVVGDRQGRLPAGDGGAACRRGAAPGGGQGRGQGGQPPAAARAGSRPAAGGDRWSAACRWPAAQLGGGRGVLFGTELYDAVIQLLQQAAG